MAIIEVLTRNDGPLQDIGEPKNSQTMNSNYLIVCAVVRFFLIRLD